MGARSPEPFGVLALGAVWAWKTLGDGGVLCFRCSLLAGAGLRFKLARQWVVHSEIGCGHCPSNRPPGGKGYVATLPTCGPLLILLPALKRWGSPIRQG